MKESIGGISLTMIVITLILLFAGIMSLTISRSNAIAVKDKIIRIIEDSNGMDLAVTSLGKPDCDNNDSTLCEIVNTINDYSYRQTGTCPADSVGYQRDGTPAHNNKDAAFCVFKSYAGRDNINRYYYKVTMFYGIDIPVLKSILYFKATGETKMLDY